MNRQKTTSSEHAAVNKICGRLHQAYRGLRLYPADHPSARQVVDAFAEAVAAYVKESGSLILHVEETRLLFDGEQVYLFTESRDNLAFLMFRDGIRSISFHPGVETRELDAFASCLSRADDLAAMEHDLATALWEQDFTGIDYQVVDPFLGGEVLHEGTIDALRETVLRRLDEVMPAREKMTDLSEAMFTKVEPAPVDPGRLALTQAEIEQGERAVVADGSAALDDFVVVLLEMVRTEPENPDGDPALLRSLAAVAGHYLEDGDLEALALLLDRLRLFERQGRRLPGFVNSVVSEAVTPESLGMFFERTAREKAQETSRTKGPEVDQVEGFLLTLLPGALPALLELLVESDDRVLRRTLLTVLESQGDIPGMYMWPLMQDSRWYVVRNAVQLMAGSSDPELPARLQAVLRHPDVRVRREAIRTLDTLVGPRPVPALLRALDDEDSSVRTLAAGVLGRHGGQEQYPAVAAHLESRSFDTRPAEEVEAFVLASAVLGGAQSIPVLDRLWRRRYTRAHSAPVRVAALMALASIPSPESEKILLEASRSREAQVRQAAARALQERQARKTRQWR